MKRRICWILTLTILLSALGAALAEGPEHARRGAGGRRDVPAVAERHEDAANHGGVEAAIRPAEMCEEGRDATRDGAKAGLYDALMQAHIDGALTNDRPHRILLSQIGGGSGPIGSFAAERGWQYDTRNDETLVHDDAQAAYWYELSAKLGNAGAQNNLGNLYADGRGVDQDDAQAVYWYRLAAEQGNAAAQRNLGYMYETGRGVAQDDAQAVYWFKLSAEQGNAAAQYDLGDMYENGRGVEQDISEAIRWYKLAAAQGVADAQDALDRLQG